MHSDIVKGINRLPSSGTGAPLPVRGNSSSTPSPVATPTLTPSHVPSTAAAAAPIDIRVGDDLDSMVDDDTTSSSQEDTEVDVGSTEPMSNVNRQARSDAAVSVESNSSSLSRYAKSGFLKPIKVVEREKDKRGEGEIRL